MYSLPLELFLETFQTGILLSQFLPLVLQFLIVETAA